jgi:small-conductance mechanosensitive channel
VFEVGIGFDDSIIDAQEIVRNVLAEHSTVLHDPEPAVLVNSLGKSIVNLNVYFWLNGREHSWLKVRSSVIRLVKLAFQKHGISMPGDAQKVIFPQGVHFRLNKAKADEQDTAPSQGQLPLESKTEDPDAVTTKAEAGLYSEAIVIEDQARQMHPLNEGENLLQDATNIPPPKKQSIETKL